MVEDGAFSDKIDYIPNFLRESKSQRAIWVKSYSDFGEQREFTQGVELHREGSALQPVQQACFLPYKNCDYLNIYDIFNCCNVFDCFNMF